MACTEKELKDLNHIPGLRVQVNQTEFNLGLNEMSKQEAQLHYQTELKPQLSQSYAYIVGNVQSRERRRVYDLLYNFIETQNNVSWPDRFKRTLNIRFLLGIQDIKPQHGIVFNRNELAGEAWQ